MYSGIKNISFKGLSACVPKAIEQTINYDWIGKEEQQAFIKNIGIEERRVAGTKTTTADLCEKSTIALLDKLNWSKESVDVLIFVSQSPDYILPATSAILQHKLGFKKSTIAFDVTLGCSGYVYGLFLLSNLISSGACKRGLLLAGDKSTLSSSYKDKSVYPLFGDAGTVTALEYDEKSETTFFNLFTDGSGYKSIIIEDGGCRNPMEEKSFISQKIEEGIERAPKNLTLDGIEIFNFALKEVAPSIQNLFEVSKLNKEEIDYFVFHQANKLINESVRKKCKVELEKVPYSIQKYGNTSSASIPLTMLYTLKNKLEQEQLTLLLSGFGVGYSWGNCILKTNKLICTEILELD
ncbi:MAG TPA: ketoacyl-ACP synthase III [Bacteroidia bacterium]|nr:ketoacyl-ACP synthase III [Bacteroidia bacterium]